MNESFQLAFIFIGDTLLFFSLPCSVILVPTEYSLPYLKNDPNKLLSRYTLRNYEEINISSCVVLFNLNNKHNQQTWSGLFIYLFINILPIPNLPYRYIFLWQMYGPVLIPFRFCNVKSLTLALLYLAGLAWPMIFQVTSNSVIFQVS
jgi:hypothetical protein